MFGAKKRHNELLQRIDRIETQHRTYYHTLSAEIACLERDIDELNQTIANINFPLLITAIENIEDNCEFICNVFENATIETNSNENLNDFQH